MLEGFKKWYHRQMVNSTAGSVKHWKWEIYWLPSVVSIMIFISIFSILVRGNYWYLFILALGVSAVLLYWKKVGKVRHMTEQERIHFFAKWNHIEPDEVFAQIKEKGMK